MEMEGFGETKEKCQLNEEEHEETDKVFDHRICCSLDTSDHEAQANEATNEATWTSIKHRQPAFP